MKIAPGSREALNTYARSVRTQFRLYEQTSRFERRAYRHLTPAQVLQIRRHLQVSQRRLPSVRPIARRRTTRARARAPDDPHPEPDPLAAPAPVACGHFTSELDALQTELKHRDEQRTGMPITELGFLLLYLKGWRESAGFIEELAEECEKLAEQIYREANADVDSGFYERRAEYYERRAATVHRS